MFLSLLILLCCATGVQAVTLDLGPSAVALNGPWKFKPGDDARWADPATPDADWSTIDLTPPPGAHDGDVGLSGYVPGWQARGFAHVSGYGWYRLSVSVTNVTGEEVWLAGPAAADSAYQVFFNGRLIGHNGDFSGASPVVTSIQPRLFALPRALWNTDGQRLTGVIAFRVWMSKTYAAADPQGGGLRIAPVIGARSMVDARYRLQWLQTVEGYAVDAIEPVFFLLLALLALSLIPFDKRDAFYPWLAAALVLLAAARANQAVYFWTQAESAGQFVILRGVLLDPLILGAWTLTWRAAFALAWARRWSIAIAVLTLTLMAAHWAGLSTVSQAARYGFILVTAAIAALGLRRDAREAAFALPALLLMSAGLFAAELSQTGVPGIWFPFGVGVSRTQYAYAAFDVALFALLLHRLWRYRRAG
ncbi:MAG TPA: hypothetical protein VGG48_01185 [Rhizomicrobium sp.]